MSPIRSANKERACGRVVSDVQRVIGLYAELLTG